MKIILIILLIISNALYSQNFIPDFDISKFIQDGGVSKEIYRNKNGKWQSDEKFHYDKEAALIRMTTNQLLTDGSNLKGINYFLDANNRVVKEEILTSDANISTDQFSIQYITIEYFAGYKVISFHDKLDVIYLREYYFYNDKNELIESFTVSNNGLTLHQRSIYYKKNGYDITEKETYTGVKNKTVVKTKFDKNGFPISIESGGKLIPDNEEIPKQITYYKNEVDTKGNLSKVFIIDGKKKTLVKEIINEYK